MLARVDRSVGLRRGAYVCTVYTQRKGDVVAVKDRRLNLRTTVLQDDRLRQAAEATNKSVSEFVLESAVERAEMVLADQRWFVLSEENFSHVEKLLERPADFRKLAELFAGDSPFGKEFSLGG